MSHGSAESDTETPGVLIVGGGQGGFQAAVSLRSEGYQGPITIVGEEASAPYQRPPLSKGLLLGKQQARHAILRPDAFYEKQSITVVTGERVVKIDRPGQRVETSSGQQYGYKHLILATGARNRTLSIPGGELDGICYLRTLEEAEELSRRIESANHVVVVGGGFIGLEVASAARLRGKQVTVLEAGAQLMGRVVAPVISDFFLAEHRRQGVKIVLNAAVKEFTHAAGKLTRVSFSVGGEESQITADVIVVGIGVVPNVELAKDAGLAVANGIAVDKHLLTDDPHIFAIGDCAEYPSVFAHDETEQPARLRLESVQNAVDHAVCAARVIMGKPEPYRAVPWFWTTQFDIHLQMAGISIGADHTVVRGDPDSSKFSLFYYRGRDLCAVDSINQPAEHLTARKLIATGAAISPEQASDENFELKSVLKA